MITDLSTLVKEFVAEGGICEVCAGVHHQRSLDLALKIMHAKRRGADIPTCSCGETCEVCRNLHNALMRHAKKEKPGETTT